jgi:hypothetical protein
MSAGKLIRVENTNWNGKPAQPELSSSRRTEFLWLCGECSSKGMVLQRDGTLLYPELCAKAAAAAL